MAPIIINVSANNAAGQAVRWSQEREEEERKKKKPSNRTSYSSYSKKWGWKR